MQALSGGPSTPIEQVTELGDGIIQKLVAAGITTVESLADMTPEQLEEIPGIGEKTLERISVAVRHYFGQFEEGEEGFVPAAAEAGEIEAAAVQEETAEAAPTEVNTQVTDVVKSGESNVPEGDLTPESGDEQKQAADEGGA
jgi:N utilization substance protein A